jgi:hypothetical protein
LIVSDKDLKTIKIFGELKKIQIIMKADERNGKLYDLKRFSSLLL